MNGVFVVSLGKSSQSLTEAIDLKHNTRALNKKLIIKDKCFERRHALSSRIRIVKFTYNAITEETTTRIPLISLSIT